MGKVNDFVEWLHSHFSMNEWLDVLQLIGSLVVIATLIVGIMTLLSSRKSNKQASARYIESMKPFISLEHRVGYPDKEYVCLRVKNTGVTPAYDLNINSETIHVSQEFHKKESEDLEMYTNFRTFNVLNFEGFDSGKTIKYLAPNSFIDFVFLTEDLYKELIAQKKEEIDFDISYSYKFNRKERETEKVNLDIGDSLRVPMDGKSAEEKIEKHLAAMKNHMEQINKSLKPVPTEGEKKKLQERRARSMEYYEEVLGKINDTRKSKSDPNAEEPKDTSPPILPSTEQVKPDPKE